MSLAVSLIGTPCGHWLELIGLREMLLRAFVLPGSARVARSGRRQLRYVARAAIIKRIFRQAGQTCSLTSVQRGEGRYDAIRFFRKGFVVTGFPRIRGKWPVGACLESTSHDCCRFP